MLRIAPQYIYKNLCFPTSTVTVYIFLTSQLPVPGTVLIKRILLLQALYFHFITLSSSNTLNFTFSQPQSQPAHEAYCNSGAPSRHIIHDRNGGVSRHIIHNKITIFGSEKLKQLWQTKSSLLSVSWRGSIRAIPFQNINTETSFWQRWMRKARRKPMIRM